MMEQTGVLVMAYGTPTSMENVDAFYTHIRRGQRPSAEQLAALQTRYEAIGGCSPLGEITRAQCTLLASSLRDQVGDSRLPVSMGLKHSAPSIRDAVLQMAREGVQHVVGIVLAPHYSTLSVEVYCREAQEAGNEAGLSSMSFIRNWHMEPLFLDAWEQRLRESISTCPQWTKDHGTVIFSAHSLPARIVDVNDPYPVQLLETSRELARRVGVSNWLFAWQSAGRTQDRWLGPDLLEVISDLPNDCRAVVSCPIGFVSDHLEVLYDLDIEARKHAEQLGLQFARVPSLNTDPLFIQSLTHVVLEQIKEGI